MKRGHLFWAKNRQTNQVIDLQGLFNEYWNSDKHEVHGSESVVTTNSPLKSDREAQVSLLLGGIVIL